MQAGSNVQYCKPVVKQNQTNIKNRLQVHRFRLELGYIIKWAIWATWHYRVHKCIPEYTNVYQSTSMYAYLFAQW